eukprot:4456961-Amphidinium_carterae.1
MVTSHLYGSKVLEMKLSIIVIIVWGPFNCAKGWPGNLFQWYFKELTSIDLARGGRGWRAKCGWRSPDEDSVLLCNENCKYESIHLPQSALGMVLELKSYPTLTKIDEPPKAI